jgi:catechol 2,3-dioxygenase-like lactoylglutathione lyase family enzyme
MTLDHVVLWVEDQLAALDFYENVIGLKAVNGDAFRAGNTVLLTVRVGPDAVIDQIPRVGA